MDGENPSSDKAFWLWPHCLWVCCIPLLQLMYNTLGIWWGGRGQRVVAEISISSKKKIRHLAMRARDFAAGRLKSPVEQWKKKKVKI